jgi:hypothetical protein
MLRLLVVILVLVNAGLLAWTQGWLGAPGHAEREPQRLAQQVRPEAVHLLPTEAPPPPVTRCLETGPFDTTEIAAAEAAIAASPSASAVAGRWERLTTEKPGVWIIAVGHAGPHATLQKKLAELERLKIPAEVIPAASGSDEIVSIGRFSTAALADEALTGFASRGIKTGRVVALSPASEIHHLRADKAPPPVVTALQALGETLPGGKGFVDCPAP